MVGQHFIEQLLTAGHDFDVTVLGAEPRPAYDRVHLSEFFAGRAPASFALTGFDDFARRGVDAWFGDPVARIDREHQQVITGAGRCFHYDRLVLATGSRPFVPALRGADRPGCHVYRTIDDLGAIRADATQCRIGTVIGGGLLGLEAANALLNLGLTTHVVELAPSLMATQLDPGAGAILRDHVERLGVHVHTARQTTAVGAGRDTRLRLRFADGEVLDTDLLIWSAGITPCDELARAAGLAIGSRGGVLIDAHCLSSDPAILAIGECAAFEDRCIGLVGPGYRMAEAAVDCLLGVDGRRFEGADTSTRLKLLGVDVGAIGDSRGAHSPDARAWVFSDERAGTWARLLIDANGRRLLGATLVGDCGGYDLLHQYHVNALDLPERPETLLLAPAADSPAAGIAALPDTAIICACHNVSRGSIGAAVAAGCTSVAAVRQGTRAGSGCGGCAGLLQSIVDADLIAMGVAVDKSLCAHFAHTRQALFHLCQVNGYRSFDALLAAHGRGRGCDICKPAVASILASLDNDYILGEDRARLQDTNDHALANLQRNGTYSIVPRVPGGEITPARLIALGEIAQRWRLYTKITGAQRIDLFGAQLHELPRIWAELIDAGFETGHAYGKALRTVKSCVGSTWCRYGVQDSVAMAIRLEHRYKGLRAPHKLKSAVSGCSRECAEAQSKDFGVIATERGWNLYVCGNGGMKPRHADLFATDLDDETLIRTIDRFLMFYVRTADRLQRTSVWLENLDGGIDYLRAVILEDSLGIGAELQAQMQAIVERYQCEWQTTLSDPQALKRFRRFVNAPDTGDPDIVMVQERGQWRPARDGEQAATAQAG